MIRRTATRTIAAALVCAGAVALGSASAGAAPATIILGAAKPAAASCPTDCLVEAEVTGFQTSIGSIRNPFVVPEDGELVAWSVKLGKPKKPDRRAFNKEFGPSSARLAVLKQVPGKSNPPRYKLLRQSPLEDLGPFFGSTTTFSLTAPLSVKKDNVVAMTIPSWAPALAVSQGNASKWLSSRRATRKRGGCTDDEGRANLEAGDPQVKKGSQRPYGCRYQSARLLYSSTFVSD